MSIIVGANLLYVANDLVVVRISAKNANGWGSTSTINAVGALASWIPTSMLPPVRATGTGENQIHL
jgi:hypothetical protein